MFALARLRQQERWALAAIAMALACVVLLPLAHSADERLLEWLHQHGRARAHAVAHELDDGARIALIVTAAAIAWHTRGRGMLRALATLGAGAFVGELLKTAIERPRPSAPFDVLVGNSMPSGHIMNTTIAAVLLCVLAFRADWPRWTRGLVLVVAGLAIAAQSTGRVMHGSHWPSDVAPSVLLGVAWVLGTVRWAEAGRLVRVAVVVGCLGAYALFYEMPGTRLHLAAPARPASLHSHAAPAVGSRL